MSFKRVSEDEWETLQLEVDELRRQLGMPLRSDRTGAQTLAQATPTGTSPPATMDNRVDVLEAKKKREAARASLENRAKHPVDSSSDSGPTPPKNLSTPNEDDRYDSLPSADTGYEGTAPQPVYPELADDAALQPGFLMTTQGNDYKWIGGDAAKVVAGDYRSITAGERVDFVRGEKNATVVGSVTNKYLSGKTDTIHGPMTQDYTGDSNRTVTGNETRVMTGDRYFKITGNRTDIMTGWKHERINGQKTEIIQGEKAELVLGVKSETILTAKHSTVAGAKIDSIDGLKVDLNKKGERVKSESALWDIGKTLGAKAAKGTWDIVKLRVKGKKFDIDSKQVNITGETKTADMSVKGLKTEKANIDNGAITT